MIVQLPSNGLYGLRQVRLATPRVGHLREIATADYTDEQVKTEFVRMLLEHPEEDFARMTMYDRDYLYAIAASAVCMNQISVDFVCPHCKASGKDVQCTTVYDITQQELTELEKGSPAEIKKSFGELEVTYRVLTVCDEERVIEYALLDFDHYVTRYESAFIAGVLGMDLSTMESIEQGVQMVNSYPVYVYFSALLFGQMVFHGVPSTCMGVCPECGGSTRVIVPFGQAVKQLDSGRLVNRFAQLSGMLSFGDFINLSMPELAQMEANLVTKPQ